MNHIPEIRVIESVNKTMFAACGTHESLVSDGGLQVMPLMPSPWGFWISVSSGDGYETVHLQCWGDWKIEFFWNNKNLQCNVGLGLELPSVFKLWLHNIAHNSGLAMIKTFDLPWWRTCKVRNFLFSVVFSHHRNRILENQKLPALTFMFQATSWGLDSSSPLGQNQGAASNSNSHQICPLEKQLPGPADLR